MKYRVFALLGMMALSAGAMLQAQDYDDIYYDASKSTKTVTKTAKPAKTEAVYGKVPEKYQVAVQDNYRLERDVDEYNRRGAYEPKIEPAFEVDINGDTIYFDNDSTYEESFANTRRIERFYNPDIVILSDDDDLVELYYDESPTINLIVGTDWGFGSYYDWGYASYYPWYTGWYGPWYSGWYSPWRWHSSWYYGYHHWGFGYYHPWYYSTWWDPYWRWGHHYNYGWHQGGNYGWNNSYHPNHGRYQGSSSLLSGRRPGLATNRNTRGRVDAVGSNRNGISTRTTSGNRSSGVSSSGSRSRSGYASSRSGGNMGSRSNSGVTSRSSYPTSRSSSGYSGGSHSSPSRSSSGSYGSGSRSSSGSSHSSGGSYSSGGSRSGGGGGGGSHGGSSGGGSRRH